MIIMIVINMNVFFFVIIFFIFFVKNMITPDAWASVGQTRRDNCEAHKVCVTSSYTYVTSSYTYVTSS